MELTKKFTLLYYTNMKTSIKQWYSDWQSLITNVVKTTFEWTSAVLGVIIIHQISARFSDEPHTQYFFFELVGWFWVILLPFFLFVIKDAKKPVMMEEEN